MYCKYCGKKIDDDSVFCNACGKSLAAEKNVSLNECLLDNLQVENKEEIIIEKPEKTQRPPASVPFLTAIKNFYANYTDFSGRAVKTEYWYVYLYNTIIALVLAVLPISDAFSYAWSILHFIPGVALHVRRLHDTGRSANFLWLLLVPIIGPILLIYFSCCNSDYDNQWGLSPYNTFSSQQTKKYHGYSAYTKNSTHTWVCDCGAKIAVSPCPFCGKEYLFASNIKTEDDLKKYIVHQMETQTLSSETRELYNSYINCIYGETKSDIEDSLKYILSNSHKLVDEKLVIAVCDKKLASLKLKRCMCCDEFVHIDSNDCACGYKFMQN